VDLEVLPIVLQQNELGMRGREKDLAPEATEQLEEAPVSRPVELARHIVEQQDGHTPYASREHVELGHLESQDDGPVLPLGRVVAGCDLTHLEAHVVAVRPVRGEASRPVFVVGAGERLT
jgi:hypothetical protein